MNKAVFLDRDGVINIDYGYIGCLDNFAFIQGVPKALCMLRQMGYLLVLVTNQSGIARGMYTEADFLRINTFMQQSLSLYDAAFDGIYYCPHHPNGQVLRYRTDCICRKPKSGMLFMAKNDLDIDFARSIMIGDHANDLIAGMNAGISTVFLVGTHVEDEYGKCESAVIKKDLSSVVDYLKLRQDLL